ncbi:MAG TPA: beta/gamma crystallin-related protein [Thermoanaerobaculia bacterium]|nr:beta/gamma crystallin-related protein [Thermoanaerobaculia bacterium]
MITRTQTLLVAAAAGLLLAGAIPAHQARPLRGQQQDGRPQHSLEITVEDMGTGTMLASLRRGDTVVIRPGQQIRLRMTGSAGPNAATRYPSTRFSPNQSPTVRIDKINPEVGSIIVTGVQPNDGPGALVLEYQVTDPMPIGDDRERRGRVYVRVEAQAPAPVPPAPPDQRLGVTLFDDENFGGRSQTFYVDDDDLRDNPIQNDTVTSVRVDPGCRVILFEDTQYRGSSGVIDRDVPNLEGTGVRNDSVSSLRVECGRATRGIIVYVDAEFRGASESLTEGDYASLDQGIGNDLISSIRVDPGCRAVLYRDDGFRGGSWTIDRDVSNLDGSPVGNDSISSIQVLCN